MEPLDFDPSERKTTPITGIAALIPHVKPYNEEVTYTPTEGTQQRQKRLKLERQQKCSEGLKNNLSTWDPENDPHVTGDPFKTLFVGRLAYSVNEMDLSRFFSRFGEVEKVRVVRDRKNISKGYGFVVFQEARDCKIALREGSGALLNERPILVDTERGRAVKNWKPRRLGGGLGGRHYTKTMEEPRRSFAPPPYRSFDRGRSEPRPFRPRGGGGGFRNPRPAPSHYPPPQYSSSSHYPPPQYSSSSHYGDGRESMARESRSDDRRRRYGGMRY